MKTFLLSLLILLTTSCSKNNDTKTEVKEEVIEFDMGTGLEVFIGTGEYGEVVANKMITFSFTRKINSEVSLGGVPELENSNFSISTKTGVCDGNPISSTQNCSVKVSFNPAGKAPGLYESVLQFGNVFVNLSAIVPVKEVVADLQVLFNKAVIESYNFGQEIKTNQMATLTIKNNGTALAEVPQVSGAGYSILTTTCPAIGLGKKKDCSVRIQFNPKDLEGENLGTLTFGSALSFPLIAHTPVKEEDNNPIKFYLGSVSESNLIESYNFGDVSPGVKLPLDKSHLSILLYNQSENPVIFPSSDEEMIELEGIKVLFNSCKNITLDKKKNCHIRFTYTPPYEVGENNGSIFYRESVLPINSNIVSDNKQLQNNNPISGILDFGIIQRNSGLSQILKMRIRNTTGSPQLFTEAPVLTNYNVVANTCLNSLLATNAYCEISVQFDSQGKALQTYHETLTMNNSLSFIEFDLQTVVIQNENQILCTMDIIHETDIDNTNGAVLNIDGEYPLACEVTQCSPLFSISPDKKSCLPDVVPCSGANIIALGGSTSNALTYSGNVVAGDASACKIATCSGVYEPSSSGLVCENVQMSDLSFLISNKNANGYVKDDSLSLTITGTNALEMKVSTTTNCSGGSWEPFANSKTFAIPFLNNGQQLQVSMRFRRGATESACLFTASNLTLPTSHYYRHDSIAPTPLTIATYTENQRIYTSSVSISGTCQSGINVERGLHEQTLTATTCNGNYSGLSVPTPTDGTYLLYARQTDLAGNVSEVIRTVIKATKCDASNALDYGIRSTYGVVEYEGDIDTTCLIKTCDAFTTKASDSLECEPKPITSGSFLIGNKNASGYTNNAYLNLTSIYSLNAKTFDVFENSNCTAPAFSINNNITTSIVVYPLTSNHSVDKEISILFKNGTETYCSHTAGAITNASANTYRHDNIPPTPVTITTTLVGNGGTITNAGITQVNFTGTCDINFPSTLRVGLYGQESVVPCTGGGVYSHTVTNTFATDTTYAFRAYQTDLAGNMGSALYYITRDANKRIIVALAGAGSGSVTGSSGGLNCGATCNVKYAPNTVVTLTATPNSQTSLLTGWTVSGAISSTCTGTTNPCTVQIGSVNDVNVQANFGLKPTYLVSVSKTGTGTGTVSGGNISCGSTCSGTRYEGETVVLSATANSDSIFMGWGGDCSAFGTSSTCSLSNITSPKNITAQFRLKNNYTFTITKTGEGTMNVSSNLSGNCNSVFPCSISVLEGSNITLTATPNSSSNFTGWGGDCSGTNSTCSFSNVLSNKNITVNAIALPPSIADSNRLMIETTQGIAVLNDSHKPVYVEQPGGPLFESGQTRQWHTRLIVNSNKVYIFKNNELYSMTANYIPTLVNTSAVQMPTEMCFKHQYCVTKSVDWIGKTSNYAFFYAFSSSENGYAIYSINLTNNAITRVGTSAYQEAIREAVLYNNNLYIHALGKDYNHYLISLTNSNTISIVCDQCSYRENPLLTTSHGVYTKNQNNIYRITAPNSISIVENAATSYSDMFLFNNNILYLKDTPGASSTRLNYISSSGSPTLMYMYNYVPYNVMNFLNCMNLNNKLHCGIMGNVYGSSGYAQVSPNDGTGNYGLFGKVFVNFTSFPGTVTENKAYVGNNPLATTYELPPPPIRMNYGGYGFLFPNINMPIYLSHNTYSQAPNNQSTKRLMLVEESGGSFLYADEYFNLSAGSQTHQTISIKNVLYRNNQWFYLIKIDIGAVSSYGVYRYNSITKDMEIVTGMSESQYNSTWFYAEY